MEQKINLGINSLKYYLRSRIQVSLDLCTGIKDFEDNVTLDVRKRGRNIINELKRG